MNGRALVTGGAGFIGSHLSGRLMDEGWDVLVVDDLSVGHLDNLAEARARGRIKFHQLDILDKEFGKAVEHFAPDVLFHLAAQTSVVRSVADPLFDAGVNILGTINLLEAARRVGVERVLFASTGGAIYGEHVKLPAKESYARRPAAPYGISKKVVEDYLRFYEATHGIDYVALGLSNVYGPRQDPYGEAGVVAIFTRLMLDKKRPVIYGDGQQTRDYVFVDDVVDAFIRAAGIGGGRFLNIGTGRETTVNRLFGAIAEEVGFRELPVFADPRPGELARSVLDPSAALHALHWQPWTSLEKGLALTVEWFRRSR
ncbi:MAG: GDP-mannose 4,6-dehydratase [Acidimicrobiia bacterium]|nr:GDP-mannose 4,6-dehydratase [Acidimicrobiia bacterium]